MLNIYQQHLWIELNITEIHFPREFNITERYLWKEQILPRYNGENK